MLYFQFESPTGFLYLLFNSQIYTLTNEMTGKQQPTSAVQPRASTLSLTAPTPPRR